MAASNDRSMWGEAWRLSRKQAGVVSGEQLRALGYTKGAIRHRIERGRLFPLWPDVFAVGRRDVPDRGLWLGATLACGEDSALSHESGAALMRIRAGGTDPVHVSVSGERARLAGIRCHRRDPMPPTIEIGGIRVIDPLWTIIDLAAHLDPEPLTRAVNEADRLGLVDHGDLASLVESLKNRRGLRKLRTLLGDYTRTDSDLERRFLRLAKRARMPVPQTQAEIDGMRLDFYWPELRLVVETDGLTYHRTPAQQAADRKRDQVLTAAGLRCVRFPNQQIREDPDDVVEILCRLRQQLQ
jgi:very-short-patch-repair endonuclease